MRSGPRAAKRRAEVTTGRRRIAIRPRCPQAQHEVEVFEQRPVAESAELLEALPAHELRLVAEREKAPARAQARDALAEAIDPAPAVEADLEGAADGAGGDRLADELHAALGKRRVGVQEEQDVLGLPARLTRGRRAAIQLPAAPAGAGDDAGAHLPGDLDGAIPAAAIGDDDVVGLRQRRSERRADRALLVERGNDDRDARARADHGSGGC